MNTALLIAQLLNAGTPAIAEIILLIKKQDGTIAIMPLIDQADSQFQKNIEQAAKWLQEHK